MPYRICKTIEIENGHLLTKHPDVCRFPHGHTRKVEFVLESQELDANEMVCDFKVVKEVIADYLATLDHALCINTEDPHYATWKEAYGDRIIPFEGEDPTTEVIARTIFHVFSERLQTYGNTTQQKYAIQADLRLVRVRVWETSSSWAEYEESSLGSFDP
ncbi:MAG: 6-carboxytetrahydropterin synthase [Verrucomicrobiota bacterium]